LTRKEIRGGGGGEETEGMAMESHVMQVRQEGNGGQGFHLLG